MILAQIPEQEKKKKREELTHPAGGVTYEVDEKRCEFGPAHFLRGCRGHGHEALCAGLPHSPHII